MTWLSSLLSRFMCTSEWREIETAPFDRQLELAVIDGGIGRPAFCGIRHGDSWLDAETLERVDVAATHWRYPRARLVSDELLLRRMSALKTDQDR